MKRSGDAFDMFHKLLIPRRKFVENILPGDFFLSQFESDEVSE